MTQSMKMRTYSLGKTQEGFNPGRELLMDGVMAQTGEKTGRLTVGKRLASERQEHNCMVSYVSSGSK